MLMVDRTNYGEHTLSTIHSNIVFLLDKVANDWFELLWAALYKFLIKLNNTQVILDKQMLLKLF